MSLSLAADLEVAAESRWQDQARCAEVDTEIFYPENGGLDRPAKKICAGCEVRAECLEFAVDNNEIWGIWGGFSERERRNMKREAAA